MSLSAMVIRDPELRMEIELEQWGRWVRSERPGGMGGNVLGALRGSTVPEPAITDDRALVIDQAMGRMARAGRFCVDIETMRLALWHQFALQQPPYKWCRVVGLSRRAAYSRVLPQAVRWMLDEVGIGDI
jgi:hypothetical protein